MPLVAGGVGDRTLVEKILREHEIDAVLHCAGFSLVAESMAQPELYFDANVRDGIALLDTLHAAGVRRVVFSSSASVYGTPTSVPVDEDAPLAPINTYGATKLAFESALGAYSRAYGWGTVALRYFNVAGATKTLGEDHRPESHLIPNILSAAISGQPVTLFGTDYPTPDGTCIRDYIHVSDLADAHLAALELTATLEPSMLVCNLGTATGFSNREIFELAEKVVGRPIAHEWGPRRGRRSGGTGGRATPGQMRCSAGARSSARSTRSSALPGAGGRRTRTATRPADGDTSLAARRAARPAC